MCQGGVLGEVCHVREVLWEWNEVEIWKEAGEASLASQARSINLHQVKPGAEKLQVDWGVHVGSASPRAKSGLRVWRCSRLLSPTRILGGETRRFI